MERRAVGRQGRDAGGAECVAAENRVERAAAERLERQPDRIVVGAGREAEQPLVAVLAQVGDCVLADERVPKRAARERVARPAQRGSGAA